MDFFDAVIAILIVGALAGVFDVQRKKRRQAKYRDIASSLGLQFRGTEEHTMRRTGTQASASWNMVQAIFNRHFAKEWYIHGSYNGVVVEVDPSFEGSISVTTDAVAQVNNQPRVSYHCYFQNRKQAPFELRLHGIASRLHALFNRAHRLMMHDPQLDALFYIVANEEARAVVAPMLAGADVQGVHASLKKIKRGYINEAGVHVRAAGSVTKRRIVRHLDAGARIVQLLERSNS